MDVRWRHSAHYNNSSDVWRSKCTFSCKTSHLSETMDGRCLTIEACLAQNNRGIITTIFYHPREQHRCQWINNDAHDTNSCAKLNWIHTSHCLKKSMIFKDTAITYSGFVKEKPWNLCWIGKVKCKRRKKMSTLSSSISSLEMFLAAFIICNCCVSKVVRKWF